MRISDNIRISEGISHKALVILDAIQKGKKPSYKVWFAVTTTGGSGDLLYILSSREFFSPLYRKRGCRLLGLAGSRQEAYDIVLDIVKTGYDNNAISDMKQFVEDF